MESYNKPYTIFMKLKAQDIQKQGVYKKPIFYPTVKTM